MLHSMFVMLMPEAHAASQLGSTGLTGLDSAILRSRTKSDEVLMKSDAIHDLIPVLNRGDFIEIQGPDASGKSQLLHQLALMCVLPPEVTFTVDTPEVPMTNIELRGWGKGAVIIDADLRWDALRLRHLLTQHVFRYLLSQWPNLCQFNNISVKVKPFVDTLVDDALRRVHIFRPKSSLSLAATLEHISAYHATRMRGLELGLLAIDSISAFYWMDKYTLDRERHEHYRNASHSSSTTAVYSGGGPTSNPQSRSPLNHILTTLEELRKTFSPVVVLTNWGLFPSSSHLDYERIEQDDANMPAAQSIIYYRQHLHPFPTPFENAERTLPMESFYSSITYHITLLPPCNSLCNPGIRGSSRPTECESSPQKSEGITGIVRSTETTRPMPFRFHIQRDGIHDHLLGVQLQS